MSRAPALSSSVSPSPRRVPAPAAAIKPKIDMILDSGAFSAFKLGKQIVLEDYINYVQDNLDWVTSYINLDVINPKDTEQSAKESFANLKIMLARGLKPMGVYHAGEDISWLYRMLDVGCDYIGLAASTVKGANAKNDWYAQAWEHLTTTKGAAVVKVHALGEGRVASLRRFPWYSADSTTWIYDAQRNGSMKLPGAPKVQHRNDHNHVASMQDIEHMDEAERSVFDMHMQKMGIDEAAWADRGSRVCSTMRGYVSLINCRYKQQLAQDAQPVTYLNQGFMPKEYPLWPADDAIPITPFKYHLVISGDTCAAAIVAHAAYDNALSSYFYMRSGKGATLRDYVQDPQGHCAVTKPYAATYDLVSQYVKTKGEY